MRFLASEEATVASGSPNNNIIAPNYADPSTKDITMVLGSGSEPGRTIEWKEDFFGDALGTNWTPLAGTDPQAAAPFTLSTAGVGGWCRLTFGDDAAASLAVNGSQLGGSLQWRANNGGLRLETRFRVGVITNVAFFFGFTDQSAALEMPFTLAAGDALTSNATDAVGVLFDTAADTDNWWLVGVANDVDATKQNAAVAPVASTVEEWIIDVTSAGVATFYRNNVMIGSAMTGAVTTSVLLCPVFVGFTRAAEANKFADVDYVIVRNARGSF
jgi:hypothetical protein